ncbi:hypothetical protein M8J77_024346 [Diaphorina citri]|nr:hypothetical protein M8J77_024346 [Diaphorina citri]
MSPRQLKNSIAKQSTLLKILETVVELGKKCLKNKADSHSLAQFQYKVSNIDNISREISELVDQVNDMKSQEDPDYDPDYSDLQRSIDLTSKIKFYQSKLANVSSDVDSEVEPKARIKLPPLELPSFNGDVNRFPVFYYAFKSMIHDNRELSDEQRIQYLIGKLSDKALSVVSGVPAIGQNYNIIWNNLVDKYLDSRVLVSSYFDQILNLKSVKCDSITHLNNFVDKFTSMVECLRALDIENLGDVLLCHIGASKLDPELRKQFEISVKGEDEPGVNLLLSFLREQVKIHSRMLSSEQDSKGSVVKQQATSSASNRQPRGMYTHAFMSNEKPVSCPVCQKSDRHPVYKCEKFLSMSVTNRHDCVAQKRLCFSCLSTYHSLKQCTSKGNCFKCGGKHHTLLHFERSSGVAMGRDNFSKSSTSGVGKQTPTGQVSDSGPSGVTHAMCSSSAKTNSSVLLSTVKVVSADYKGSAHELRLLLDTGSESNFLTESAVRKLGLNVTKVPSSVQGICGVSSPVKGKVGYQFKSRFDENVKFSVSALVVSKISDNLPVQPLNTECLSHLKNVLLSDNEFNVSKPVDGILGAYMFSILLESGKIVGCQNCPVAVNTLLGYTVMGGKSSDQNVENSFFCGLLNNPLENSLEFSMRKFMEIEDVPMNTVSKPEDTVCESLFRQTFKHESGKFQVSLPFKEAPEECLGESYHIAQKRFINLERKLLNSEDATLHSQYCEVMKEFLSSGYMSLVNNDISREGYYIPQHVVVRKDHASFKLRPVFDASCATSSGKSLNDILYTGPKLYNDLFNILLSFRLFPYALTTDIRKMYLQILVSEDQRKYQKVLCRFSPQEELQTYTLNTVTFGLACSPYLALRCVKELASMERENYPLASERVQVDSYMDDICSSVSSESEACELQSQLVAMFKTGGFQLSKWASNSSTLLSRIPDEDKLESCLKWDDSSLKVLGLMWHPVTDSFSFEVNIKTTVCTKRNVLKLTASIFDVLGLLAPVTLYAKLLIKYLWQENIGWDSTPPAYIQDVWNVFQQELSLLSNMSFNRHIDVYLDSDVTLVGFGDASEKAYACAIYSVVKSPHGEVLTNLICAKSKVSPLKTLSIPRLELCAALLLSKLMKLVVDTYSARVKIKQIFCLSDSKVVLDWVRSPPYRWNQFVSNRVSKIQENVSAECFHHIAGKENISDCVSRGMLPSQLVEYSTWTTGPDWLKHPVSEWPLDLDTSSISEDVDREEKKRAFVTVQPEPSVLLELAKRHSSWLRLLHAIVYVLRFLKLLPPRDGRVRITTCDMQEAETRLLKAVQQECFAKEIDNLKGNKVCSPSIQKLNPFLHNGMVLVGGRLSNSSLGYEQKHPVLLPSKHHVTTLLIEYYHRINLHTGPHLLLSVLRQKYWILGGRNVVRQRVRKCNHCFKFKPEASSALMGELPKARVNESKPFVHTGTDYTGFINVTMGKRRGVISQKAYICIFVCLCTKAIHLELAADLSTDAFMAAFKRFLARRGAVSVMYSDGGKNFLGARNQLDEIYNLLESQSFNDSLSGELQRRRIKWSFLPPLSPHMGGLWEGNIRMVKQHLLKVIGTQVLTYEELYTVLTQVECLLNSRPLCPLSSDPNDVQVLTPAHFLHSNPLDYIPAVDMVNRPSSGLRRYQLLDQLVQTYWKRWSQEYLHNLQVRSKWNTDQNPVHVGQVVLVKDDLAPPLMWHVGLITGVYPGADGIVRVVCVKTKTGSYKRPIVKVCPLPSQ